MTIDPRLYEKCSGRSGDPYRRLGEALAKNAKHKQERDALRKGISGGLRNSIMPGIWANLWFFLKLRKHDRQK